MKIKFYFLALSFLSIYQVSAQTITIGGTCSDAGTLGVYNYDGDINGKPSYRKGSATTSDCSIYPDDATCTAAVPRSYLVKWNGSAWEWSYSNTVGCVWLVQLCVPKSVSSSGPEVLLATNTGDTSLPSCTGWIAEAGGCLPDITAGCETLGVLQNTFSSNIAFYPNPTDGKVSIDLGSNNSAVNVRLTNPLGKNLWTKNFNNASLFHINIDQPAGIYFIEIIGEKGEKAYFKMAKK